MGTRSVVYAKTEQGIVGVYVHWDGYPGTRLPILHRLIERDGAAKVVATILGKPSGWSNLDPDQQADELGPLQQDGRFEAVPGYGVQYTDVDGQSETEYRSIYPDDRSWDIEYVYVFGHDNSILWAPNSGLPWDELPWETSTAEVTA